MRPYEVMAIFEATTDPTVIQGVLDRVLELIRTTGGNPGAIDRWGKRTFAYEVNHKREGYYVVVEFTSDVPTVDALDRMLEHARGLGANAVIGLRYDATEIMQGVTEVLCYGTAVLVEPVASA